MAFSPYNEKSVPFGQKVKDLIFNTHIEIYACLLAVAALAGTLSYREAKKEQAHLPVAFSEIESITAQFNTNGKPVPALTQQYALSNDCVMEVFQANDDALAKDNNNTTFARALEKQAHSRKYADFSQVTKDALRIMEKPTAASAELAAVTDAFSKAWDDNHHDHNFSCQI